MGGFKLGSTIVLVFEAPKNFVFDVKEGQHVKVGEPMGGSSSRRAVSSCSASSRRALTCSSPSPPRRPHRPSRAQLDASPAPAASHLPHSQGGTPSAPNPPPSTCITTSQFNLCIHYAFTTHPLFVSPIRFLPVPPASPPLLRLLPILPPSCAAPGAPPCFYDSLYLTRQGRQARAYQGAKGSMGMRNIAHVLACHVPARRRPLPSASARSPPRS